ncbi:MAG: Ku protein [Proteobacteria bacterium]|nr:MAG: Ku protein [Pseudomonadota bacterium]
MPRSAKRGRAKSKPRKAEPSPKDAKAKDAKPSDAAAADAPVARAVWSGSITFGLVTVPVELYSATRRRGLPLRMLGPEGVPLSREYVCPEEEDRPLEGDEIERGYEVRDGEFVLVSDEELEAISPRRSRDIELVRFVDRAAIDPSWFVRPYFLVPDADQSKAYRLLAETMERTGRAALAHFVMRGKGYPVAIFADRGVLRAETLRYGDELRSAEDVGLPAPDDVDAKRVARMRRAIDALAADALDESELVDEGARRLRDVAERKRARGEDVVEAPAAEEEAPAAAGDSEGGEVVDLLALIRQRLQGGAAPRPKRAAGRKRGEGEDERGATRGAALQDETKQALLERAKQLDIPGRSRMTRDELIASIRRAS